MLSAAFGALVVVDLPCESEAPWSASVAVHCPPVRKGSEEPKGFFVSLRDQTEPFKVPGLTELSCPQTPGRGAPRCSCGGHVRLQTNLPLCSCELPWCCSGMRVFCMHPVTSLTLRRAPLGRKRSAETPF